jgi:hypothetical protein
MLLLDLLQTEWRVGCRVVADFNMVRIAKEKEVVIMPSLVYRLSGVETRAIR